MGDSDSDLDDIMMFPITDLEAGDYSQANGDRMDAGQGSSDDESPFPKGFRPTMSLRQRRWSKLGFGNGPLLNVNVNEAQVRQFKAASERRNKNDAKILSPGKRNWMRALKKIKEMKDPWAQFNIVQLKTETAVRHRYNALKKKWIKDEVQIKMETEPFNHGAMRACYRLKKLSSFSKSQDWKTAMNYVAKCYMEDVDRDVYFEDVRLQMDTKLWGEEYNRHNPPKKVDIFQMCILEMKDRPGKPLYHLEHFIEGTYIKYNSNSGFVEENIRFTPQAFSHFTFERSGHQLIVVDIQGVGDLWTDPQMHTAQGEGYGDGNLGTRGMALFFHSHVCNVICKSLHLSPFDLAPSEVEEHENFMKRQRHYSGTIAKGHEEMVISASPCEKADLTAFLLRSRTRSTCSTSSLQEVPESPISAGDSAMDMDESSSEPPDTGSTSPMGIPIRRSRVRVLSDSDSGSSSLTESDCFSAKEEEERLRFQQHYSNIHRPSCIANEINIRRLSHVRSAEDSVLGQIHHDMAKYHELGRFAASEDEIDLEAGLFHELQAADLGVLEAINTVAKLYLGIQRDVLINYTVQDTEENISKGVDYMVMAAEAGDRAAMIYMANAFESGQGLGDRSRSYADALHWYEAAVNQMQADESGEFDATMDTPVCTLQAKMAELLLTGDFGLPKDPQKAGDLYTEAAESAMEAMKGRLANKYYGLAEEAWALCEGEDGEE